MSEHPEMMFSAETEDGAYNPLCATPEAALSEARARGLTPTGVIEYHHMSVGERILRGLSAERMVEAARYHDTTEEVDAAPDDLADRLEELLSEDYSPMAGSPSAVLTTDAYEGLAAALVQAVNRWANDYGLTSQRYFAGDADLTDYD